MCLVTYVIDNITRDLSSQQEERMEDCSAGLVAELDHEIKLRPVAKETELFEPTGLSQVGLEKRCPL